MKKLIPLLFLAAACTQPATSPAPALADPFAKVQGCFLLYNMKTQTFEKAIGEESCRERLPACSTFKVPLAVMAFDSGALKDENQVLKWDGTKHPIESQNRDHDAKSWMKDSVVWFSQKLTPKMGVKKVRKYLDGFDYGNKDMKGGLTQAWLVRPSDKGPALKINAYEQIEFMKKLWTDALPASKRAMRLTRDITFLETSPKGFRLSGKTGSNFYDHERKIRLGWFISHLERDGEEYLTATVFRDPGPTEDSAYGGAVAKQLTKDLLFQLGKW